MLYSSGDRGRGECYSGSYDGDCRAWYYGVVTLYFEQNGLLSSANGCQ